MDVTANAPPDWPAHARATHWLSAHDFCQIFGAPQVVMCRADKVDGQPQVPSRWWMRLDVYLQMTGLADKMAQQSRIIICTGKSKLAKRTVTSALIHLHLALIKYRPKTLSVTRIEILIKDPIAFMPVKFSILKNYKI